MKNIKVELQRKKDKENDIRELYEEVIGNLICNGVKSFWISF